MVVRLMPDGIASECYNNKEDRDSEWFNPDCPTFDGFYIPIVPQAFYVYLYC